YRRAEEALRPEDPHGGRDLGDRLLRAVVRLRHGGGEDARRAAGRLLRRQWPEDLDDARAHLGLVLDPRPYEPGRAEVGGALAAPRRHEEPRDRDPPDPADRRRL